MTAPLGAPSLPEAIRAGAQVYAALKALLAARGLVTGLGDEGGFAPDIERPEDVLTLLVQAITDAGYPTGSTGVAIARDPAANEFYRDGAYHVAGTARDSDQMVDWYAQLAADFPIWSVEDGLAEADWQGWATLTARLGDQLQLVGDDIFVTNPTIIADAASRHIANGVLIKVNQIRHRHPDPAGPADLPRRRVRRDGLPPVRGNRGRVHRRPDGRRRLRTAQGRRARPRRTGRQVQPAARNRRQPPRAALRPSLVGRSPDRRAHARRNVTSKGRDSRGFCLHRPAGRPADARAAWSRRWAPAVQTHLPAPAAGRAAPGNGAC